MHECVLEPQVYTARGLHVCSCGYARVHYTPDCPAISWGVLTGLYPTSL